MIDSLVPLAKVTPPTCTLDLMPSYLFKGITSASLPSTYCISRFSTILGLFQQHKNILLCLHPKNTISCPIPPPATAPFLSLHLQQNSPMRSFYSLSPIPLPPSLRNHHSPALLWSRSEANTISLNPAVNFPPSSAQSSCRFDKNWSLPPSYMPLALDFQDLTLSWISYRPNCRFPVSCWSPPSHLTSKWRHAPEFNYWASLLS